MEQLAPLHIGLGHSLDPLPQLKPRAAFGYCLQVLQALASDLSARPFQSADMQGVRWQLLTFQADLTPLLKHWL